MKKKIIYLVGGLFFIIGFAVIFFNKPNDIRNDFLKKGITEESKAKGLSLIEMMEEASGGRKNWDSLATGTFVQEADWYGRTGISHWDTIPQLYKMKSVLGSFDCEMELLNGHRKGKKIAIKEGSYFQQNEANDWIVDESKEFESKMIYKAYWFQFPFRIGEAEIISYAGLETINEKTYDLVYATWESEKANREFDQFILYLDQETHLVEYLHFTVREVAQAIEITAKFSDFREVDGITLPFSQFVSHGKPGSNGIKLHENHYQEISFGEINPQDSLNIQINEL